MRPVGVMVLASAKVGAYDDADRAFLGRVANYVAIAVDDVRRSEEAQAHQRRVEAERDRWRTLLEINNALVTNLDLKALRAAIAPSLRRIVPHDTTSLMLLRDEGKQLGALAFDPEIPPWAEEIASALAVSGRCAVAGHFAAATLRSTGDTLLLVLEPREGPAVARAEFARAGVGR